MALSVTSGLRDGALPARRCCRFCSRKMAVLLMLAHLNGRPLWRGRATFSFRAEHCVPWHSDENIYMKMAAPGLNEALPCNAAGSV